MKGLIVHGLLAAFGLSLAYAVWTRGDAAQSVEDQVTIWDCDAGRVSGVHLTDDHTDVTVEARGSGSDRYWWIKSTFKPAKGAPVTTEFTGSDQVKAYLKSLAPLRARRELGDLGKSTLKEVGLDKPTRKLVVTCGGTKRTFVGGQNAFGTGDLYLRDARGGSVYLADANLMRELESARIRLMQRSLNHFAWADIDRVKVQADGKERTLLQRNRLDPRRAEWVDAGQPDRRNELYGNWIDRVRRLGVTQYLAPGKAPPSPEPIAKLEFVDGDGQVVDHWELVRTGSPDEAKYFARSRATRSWVELPASMAKDVGHDVQAVVGAD